MKHAQEPMVSEATSSNDHDQCLETRDLERVFQSVGWVLPTEPITVRGDRHTALADNQFRALFMSLLDAMAWMALKGIDLTVFVGKQRQKTHKLFLV